MEKALYEVLRSGRWGTISPKSLEAAEVLMKYMDKQYGICTHSLSAALESLLRSLDIGYGDQVIVASYGNPVDPMVVAAIGAQPVFADIDISSCTVSADSVIENINEKTKAVVIDSYAGEYGNIDKLTEICKEKGIYIVLNLGDELYPVKDDVSAIVVDIGSESSLNVGLGAAILTDYDQIYQVAFAYHNCGRVPGEVNNLKVENFIGGNMRIAEWQACLVESHIQKYEEKRNLKDELSEPSLSFVRGFNDRKVYIYDMKKNDNIPVDEYILTLNEKGIHAKQQYVAMHKEPFFCSEYYRKLTGCDCPGIKEELVNSLAAKEQVIWIY